MLTCDCRLGPLFTVGLLGVRFLVFGLSKQAVVGGSHDAKLWPPILEDGIGVT